MKKTLLFLLLAIIFLGCVDPFLRHHIMLNDKNGLDTIFDPKTRQLSLASKEPFVLFFYDTDCGACKAQLPDINELSKQFKDRVKFIGVLGGTRGFDEDIKLLNEHSIAFATTSDPVSVEYFSKAVGGVNGVPVTYIFNAEGKNLGKILGYTPKAAISKKIMQVF